MNALTVISLLCIVGFLSEIFGYKKGYRKGRSFGWVECQESIWAKERARRDKRGRFKAVR